MYTGTEKKAIVLKNSKNCIFEAAYFILKDDISNIKESEMVIEANKILKNNIIGGYFFKDEKKEKEKEKQKNNGRTQFLLGAFLSFVLCTVIFLALK